MAEKGSTATVNVGSPEEPGAPTKEHEVAVSELFHWIYRFFYSKTVGLILILVMAFYAVIGSVISQTTQQTLSDPAAKQQFMDQMRGVYGGWTPILDALGFFHVFTSLGFYVVVALLALSILACTTHRLPELWRRQNSPRLHVSRTFFDRARYRGLVVTGNAPAESLSATGNVLRRNRFRVLADPKDPDNALYADRFAWSGIGTVLAHLSFIIILLAFVISATWAIEEELAVPVGGEVEVGYGTGLTLHAHSFSDTYTDEGRPSDYVSVLELREGERSVVSQEVRVNSPLDYGKFRYHQSTFGIAADVSVEDLEGQELLAEAIPLKWSSNDGEKELGRFDIPNTDLEVVIVLPASGSHSSGIPAGSAVFEMYAGEEATPIDVVPAAQGDPVQVGEYTLKFERERQYTGIRMRHDPGAPWMWAGSIFLVVGMSITFMFPYRRLWVRVDTGETDKTEVRFGAVSRLDYSYQRMFEKLVGEVDEELGADPAEVTERNHG